jgi:hypothetical protein
MFLKKAVAITISALSLSPFAAQAELIAVTNEKEECFFVEVTDKSTLKEVAEKIAQLEPKGRKSKRLLVEMDFEQGQYQGQSYYPGQQLEQGQEPWNLYAKKHGQFLGTARNYHAPLTPQEKGDIRYIIVTLANRSLISIARCKETLEMCGDRIDHLHPLKFLYAVFSDEELKVGIRNVRSRGWIWGDFISGIRESFITEASNNNITHEHLHHLAQSVGIDASLILPSAQAQNWDELIEIMIVHVPRGGDHGRFDS